MLTLQMTAGNNNETIWMLRINTSTPIYLSTGDITLDNVWDGQVLNFDNYLSELNQSSTIQSSGGTGEVSSMSFSISRYVGNANFDNFFNDWYPATGKGYLSGVTVDFGVCWVGATADTDITWLFRGRVVDYAYEQRRLNITVFQESEISNKEVPYYAVQKDFDNGVSYFANAPEDSYGRVIPIVYGDFTLNTTGSYSLLWDVIVSPAIPVYKRLTEFIVCSHEAYEVSEDQALFANAENFFRYMPELNAFMLIRNNVTTDSTTANNKSSYTFAMTNRGSRLIGAMKLRLAEQSESSSSGVTDIDEVIDKDPTNYSSLDAIAGGDNQIALRTIGIPSTSDFGFLGIVDEDVGLRIYAGTDGGGNRNYSIAYYNNSLATPAGDTPATGTFTTGSAELAQYDFGTNTGGKKDAIIPWTIEEVCGLEFLLQNNQTTPGEQIRVYYGYLILSNIIVYAPNFARSLRNNSGGRSVSR